MLRGERTLLFRNRSHAKINKGNRKDRGFHRSGAGSWLQMPKSSSNSAVSRTPVSNKCFCLLKVVRPHCMAPFSLFIPGLLPLSPIHLYVAGREGLYVRIVSHRQRSISVLYL